MTTGIVQILSVHKTPSTLPTHNPRNPEGSQRGLCDMHSEALPKPRPHSEAYPVQHTHYQNPSEGDTIKRADTMYQTINTFRTSYTSYTQ